MAGPSKKKAHISASTLPTPSDTGNDPQDPTKPADPAKGDTATDKGDDEGPIYLEDTPGPPLNPSKPSKGKARAK